MSAGREAQEEELTGLEAVYGPDVQVDSKQYICHAFVPSRAADPHITLTFRLPEDYPEKSPPGLEVLASHLAQEKRVGLKKQLQARFKPGRYDKGKTQGWTASCLFQGFVPATHSLQELGL